MSQDVQAGWDVTRRWTIEPAGGPALALADLSRALALWPLWVRLGWHDILYRYRRSLLGPFWFTLNTAVLVLALGLVYSRVLNVPAWRLMPFLCAGLLIWNFLSAMLLGAGEVFCGAESYIKQVRLPYLLHVFRFVFGRLLILAHDVPILIVLMVWFGIRPGPATLLALPGLLLLLFNGVLISLTLAVVSARFRDIPRILASSYAAVVLDHAHSLDAGAARRAQLRGVRQPLFPFGRDRPLAAARQRPHGGDGCGCPDRYGFEPGSGGIPVRPLPRAHRVLAVRP